MTGAGWPGIVVAMLNAGTLERLVYLRLMLREAQNRAQDRTHAGRHSAAIQLDGVCEHAMMLAVGHLQETPRSSFHANYDLLKNRLRGAWSADGWSGVNRLHGTRTEAQHRGTVPDPAEFTRWSADAERFVNSLVAAAFDVDLQAVSTAQAVQDAELRTALETAENQLAAGRFKESLTSTSKALKDARRRWSAERTDAVGSGKSRPTPMEDITAGYVRDAVDRMEDLAEVSTFASDLGEYVWLRSVERHLREEIPVDGDDAERALTFVVAWVLRWEAFSHRYTMDRRGRWRRSRRAQTTSDPSARPRIGAVSASVPERRAPNDERTPAVTVTLVDLPEPGAEMWLQLFGEKFRATWRESGLQKDERGGLPWTTDEGQVTANGIATEAAAETFVELVKTLVDETVAAWEEARAADAETKPDTEALKNEFASALAGIHFREEPLITDVTARTFRAGRGVTAPLAASIEVSLRIGRDRELWHRFWQALNATGELGPGHNAPLNLHKEVLRAPTTMPAERLRDVLATATAEVERELAELEASRDRDEQLRQAIEAAAQASAAMGST